MHIGNEYAGYWNPAPKPIVQKFACVNLCIEYPRQNCTRKLHRIPVRGGYLGGSDFFGSRCKFTRAIDRALHLPDRFLPLI